MTSPIGQDRARQWLSDFGRQAEERLRAHFARWARELPSGDHFPTPRDVYEAVTELTERPAKRLRPALAYHTALCFEHDSDPRVLFDASLGMELLQTALLIHDDVMDRDERRRGGPTVHHRIGETLDDTHLGVAFAILAGSIGYALAHRLVLESGLADNRLKLGCAELVRMQYEVIYGQALDLVGGAPPATIHSWKTTSYTTEGPVRFGAAIAGAPQSAHPILAAYAHPLGRAFQMRDDLLGVFGDPSVTGKPVGSDLLTGKRTDLIENARGRATPTQWEIIEAVLGEEDSPADAVARACAAITESGARDDVERQIVQLTERAVEALDGSDLRPEGADFLRGVAALLADRTR